MFTQEVTVNNEVGLHARPATYFIQKANEFKSGIWVEKDERRVNAKSLLGVLSLGIVKGTTITLIADGPDAKEAVESLTLLVSDQLGEETKKYNAGGGCLRHCCLRLHMPPQKGGYGLGQLVLPLAGETILR